MRPPRRRGRGRPPKFGRRGQVVAVTLPHEVVRGLRKRHADLGWAIVSLFEQTSPATLVPSRKPLPDAELVAVARRQSLIVVNKDVFSQLPGVSIIPLHDDRAFLALEPGRGMSDLELAVLDRLAMPGLDPREHKALVHLRDLLRALRRDPTLSCLTRAIIVLERGERRASSRNRKK